MEKRTPVTNPVSIAIQLLIVLVILPFSPIFITLRWTWGEAWLYGIISASGFIISRILAAGKHPDIVKERAESFKHKDTKSWDKVLAPMLAFGSGLIPVAAGIDALCGLSPGFNVISKIIAVLLILSGYALGTYALTENRYFSGTVRIQTERGHSVVTTGPYQWIRHPGYAGALIANIGVPILLDSYWAFIPVVCVAVIVFIRTYLEDTTLQKELEGYREYAKKTGKRLIPFIW
ncbi:MAG: isoprenylcysteine carboxylmethyltransferase family protein [Spirochaetales bacterium]|nr:isoprenylcysteine carboxylmethyltransferase family protein [Spirochaetales bacterium]